DGSTLNRSTFRVSGLTEPGATLRLSVNGNDVGPVTLATAAPGLLSLNAAGQWSVTVGPLEDGTHQLEAFATDAAGNVGPVARTQVSVDTVAPTTRITSGPHSPEASGTARSEERRVGKARDARGGRSR